MYIYIYIYTYIYVHIYIYIYIYIHTTKTSAQASDGDVTLNTPHGLARNMPVPAASFANVLASICVETLFSN